MTVITIIYIKLIIKIIKIVYSNIILLLYKQIIKYYSYSIIITIIDYGLNTLIIFVDHV